MLRPFSFLLFLFCDSLLASSFSQKGEVHLEFRRFKNDEIGSTRDQAYSLFSRLETAYEEEGVKLNFRGYGRVDPKNSSRNIMVFEDSYIDYSFSPDKEGDKKINLFAGWKIFNWSATEAFHPADIINSRNYDSNLENLEKVGELSLGIEGQMGMGELGLYFFPQYERPRYPGKENRLGLGVDFDRPVWIDGEKNNNEVWGIQYGAYSSWNLGDADLSFFAISHMDRTYPLVGTDQYARVSTLIVPSGIIPLENASRPYYFKTFDSGFTYQHVFGSFILKMESVYKNFLEEKNIYTTSGLRSPDDHGENALGLEYDYTSDGGSDWQFFLEAQSFYSSSKAQRAEMSVFQNDIMLGMRFAANDVMGSEFFISLIADWERSHEYLGNMVFMRRLSDSWKFKTGLRYFDAPKKENNAKGLENLNQDHHFFASLIRYF